MKVIRQTAARTFGAGATHTVSGGADLAVGDVTTDGRDDIVTSRPAAAALSMLDQNGTGGLVAAPDATVAAVPRPIAIADIDHDAANDIVVLHDSVPSTSTPASVGWLRQAAPGVFDAETTFSIGDFAENYDAKALAVGDVEGDGRDDVVVATSFGVSLLVQNSGVLPTLAPAWVTDVFPQSLATNVAAGVNPAITLGRTVTNFSSTRVQLRNESGVAVPSTSAYDSGTGQITITPNAPLANGSYAVHVSGLTDTNGATLADAGSTFTVGPPPDETAPQTTLHSAADGRAVDGHGDTLVHLRRRGRRLLVQLRQRAVSPVSLTPARDRRAGDARFPACSPATRSGTKMPRPRPRRGRTDHRYTATGCSGARVLSTRSATRRIWAVRRRPARSTSTSPRRATAIGSSTRSAACSRSVTPERHGDAPALAAGDSVTSISRTASGNGYWLFTARGRVLPFGDAHFYGDMSNTHLNGPVLDSVRTASGRGYYMVASDGGVFSFGDARFYGSTGNIRLNAPVRSLVPDPDGAGYWLVAVDGGVFAFDAPFRGSMGATHLNRPVVGMVAFGNGYLMVGADGGIFDFSSKPFLGSLGSHPPSVPIVSVAAFG